MTHVAHIDLANYRDSIAEDVRNLIEKYHSIVEDNSPDIDDDLADAFILLEMRNALKNIQDDKLEKIIN
ncbi:hypothetical protein GCM10011613_11930 [Cellvibrio zantedeschiae]|uniref:Uncharacterized protein n=1 Tax=Cellvibrio zantedeschiae TaxID=1237077 RepID=A0ABQ3AVJ0_9GAMM|nr:hypothetical protein [Cellvibrio zantedeschiae]GGY69231.1 hypothetical protein GCM10011613_11930 [Cellvibrio zantedeschiae]